MNHLTKLYRNVPCPLCGGKYLFENRLCPQCGGDGFIPILYNNKTKETTKNEKT